MPYVTKPEPADAIPFPDLGAWLRERAVNKRLVPSYSTLITLRSSGFIPAFYGESKRTRYVLLSDLPRIARTLGIKLIGDPDDGSDVSRPVTPQYAVRNLAA